MILFTPTPEHIAKLRVEFAKYKAHIQPIIDDYDKAVENCRAGSKLPEAEWLALLEIVFVKWRVYISCADEYWRDYETTMGVIG